MLAEIEILPYEKIYRDALFRVFDSNNKPEIIRYFNPFPLNADSVDKIQSANKDYYCVIFTGKVLVGFGMLRGWDDGYDVPSMGLLVDEQSWGKGFGVLICEHLCHYAKSHGSKYVRLSVYRNNAKAYNLFLKMGFVETGDVDNGEGKVIMKKEV